MPASSPHLSHAPGIATKGSGNWWPVGGLEEARNDSGQCTNRIRKFNTIVGLEGRDPGDKYLDVERERKEGLWMGGVNVFYDVLRHI